MNNIVCYVLNISKNGNHSDTTTRVGALRQNNISFGFQQCVPLEITNKPNILKTFVSRTHIAAKPENYIVVKLKLTLYGTWPV